MSYLAHLARRLLESLRARRLGPAEQAEVAGLLRPTERGLFWGQSAADQRHGLACAHRVLASAPERADLARAALLHDAGKSAARLGPIGRVTVTGLALLHLPTPGRLSLYRRHGALGAAALQAAGAEILVVEYARCHHEGRPPSIPPADWELLAGADRS